MRLQFNIPLTAFKKLPMKKILTFLLMAITVQLSAQNYLITGIIINLPANPDANIANWGSGTAILTINASTKQDAKGSISEMVKASKILVTIKKSGAKICGSFSNSTAPASNFTTATKVWSGRNAVSLLGQDCILKPGEYELCVQFFGPKNDPISDEKCKAFSIRAGDLQSYQPPQAIAPADGTVINEADAKKPVTFRWTPVTPKPKEPVTYKLRIYEVKQGQTATAVVKSAIPLHEKDIINQTQYVLPSLSQLNATKGSSFAWTVQALGQKGNPVGGNNGMSGINTLKIVVVGGTGCFKLDTTQYKIECAGMSPTGQIIYHVSNLILVNIGSGQGRTGLHNTPQTNVIAPVGFSVNNLTPSGGAIINAGMSTSISFNIIGATGTTATFYVQGTVITDSDVYCDERIKATIDLPPCICNDCDSIRWNFKESNITTQTGLSINSNNTAFLTQSIEITPYQVLSVKAEIVNFNWYSKNEECKKCSSNDYDWGNFVSGTFLGNGFQSQGTPPIIPNGLSLLNCHELNWGTTDGQPKILNGTIRMNISLPPATQLECCNDCFRFCIRYSVTIFKEGKCITCSTIRCYELLRQHRPSQPTTNLNPCGGSISITPDPIKIK